MERKDYQKKQSLCWSCVNAVPDEQGHGCPWSRNGDEVEGWTVEQGKNYLQTYRVRKCPLYKHGDAVLKSHEVHDENFTKLCIAVVLQAAKDYRKECLILKRIRKENKEHSTRFALYGRNYTHIYGLTSQEEVERRGEEHTHG